MNLQRKFMNLRCKFMNLQFRELTTCETPSIEVVSRTCMGLAYACSSHANTMQIQYLHHANTMQESHAATSALCKYICKPQFLHAFAYASPCKPMQARCKSRASSCRRMRPEPNHSQCCQMFKKDESRLLEVVGSIPSMCLHVSVLCLMRHAWLRNISMYFCT